MLITCPRCQTTFHLADERLPSAEHAMVKCSRCKTVFPLLSDELPVPESLSPDAGPDLLGENPEMQAEESDERGGVPEMDVPPPEMPLAEGEFAGTGDAVAPSPELTPVTDGLAGGGLKDAVEEQQTADAEMVFEMADDFSEDDLSWDVDLDDDEETAGGGEGSKTAGDDLRQTTLDETDLDETISKTREETVEINTVTADSEVSQAAGAAAPVVSRGSLWPRMGGRRMFLYLGLIVAVLSLALWGGVLLWQKFSIDMEQHLSLVGLESRNMIFSADKRVIVLQGKVYNTAPKMVGALKIKGVLIDRQGNALAERTTSGGVTFSSAELQSLNEEMIGALENASATVAADGGELPFMLVFYDYPPAAATFVVELAEFTVLRKGEQQ
ncbi:MAG: zinc-ribbon domain-containing protein [Deltaproteobacteria bacterium]|nr:zinc-ribbon domain-containing protein [Deltaproteobacteria bacterium]